MKLDRKRETEAPPYTCCPIIVPVCVCGWVLCPLTVSPSSSSSINFFFRRVNSLTLRSNNKNHFYCSIYFNYGNSTYINVTNLTNFPSRAAAATGNKEQEQELSKREDSTPLPLPRTLLTPPESGVNSWEWCAALIKCNYSMNIEKLCTFSGQVR